MSTQYRSSSEVPTGVLIDRLEELSTAITKGKKASDEQFTMRVPAECDRDADLVLAEVARRLDRKRNRIVLLEAENESNNGKINILKIALENEKKKKTVSDQTKRRIDIFDWKKKDGEQGYEKVLAETGVFIEYGCNFEEVENGVGTYSTCIIEMEDGTIRNVPVELVQFKDH